MLYLLDLSNYIFDNTKQLFNNLTDKNRRNVMNQNEHRRTSNYYNRNLASSHRRGFKPAQDQSNDSPVIFAISVMLFFIAGWDLSNAYSTGNVVFSYAGDLIDWLCRCIKHTFIPLGAVCFFVFGIYKRNKEKSRQALMK